MITLKPTRDFALVKRVLTHPRIWPFVGDDHSGSPEDFRPNEDPRVLYLAAYDGEELLGVFLALNQSTVLWELHVAMLPAAWGARSRQAGRDAVAWIFEHTTCKRLIGQIPETNQNAIAYGRAIGMRAYGRNPRCFERGGRLLDVVLLGVSK